MAGDDRASADVSAGLDSFSTRALRHGSSARLRPGAEAPRRLLLLSAAVGGQRLQALEPVHAVDGATGRNRSGCLDEGAGVTTDCAARHARDSRRTVPASHTVRQPGLEDGRGDHRLAEGDRSGRSGAIRLFTLPSRDDERLRIQARAEGFAVSAARRLPACWAYTAAVSSTIRSTVNSFAHARERGLAHGVTGLGVLEQEHQAIGHRPVVARRHQVSGFSVDHHLGNPAGASSPPPVWPSPSRR